MRVARDLQRSGPPLRRSPTPLLFRSASNENVTILFDEYDRENWATGGELHIDKFAASHGLIHTKILIVGTLRLPPGSLDTARAAMREMITASRSEEGCIEYTYSDDAMEPALIHVKEIWESREALQIHFQSSHLRTWRSTWGALLISDRKLALYEMDDPEQI
jgi:quinol monooxygenase YgiN